MWRECSELIVALRTRSLFQNIACKDAEQCATSLLALRLQIVLLKSDPSIRELYSLPLDDHLSMAFMLVYFNTARCPSHK